MGGFFNADAQRELAVSNPSSPQATVGEAASAAWNLQRDQRTYMAMDSTLFDEYEGLRRTYHGATGNWLYNPWLPSAARGDTARRARLESTFFEQVNKLRESEPELDLPHTSPEGMRNAIAQRFAGQREHAADVDQRSRGFLTNTASFFGTAGAATFDPPVLLSMFLGLPWSAGVLRGALLDAGIGAATEVVIQADVQLRRREIGEDPSLAEAAAVVGSVGVGGFALSGLLRGGVKGTKALLARSRALPTEHRTAEVRAAEKYLARVHELEDANPHADTFAGRAAHQQALDEAFIRLTRTETAVGRVLDADKPHRIEVTEVATRAGEPVESFFARLRAGNPQLFTRYDAVGKRIEVVQEKLRHIRETLAQPVDRAAAEEMGKLRTELATATDRRKIKRLQRRIAEVERRAGPDLEAKAKKAAGQRARLASREVKLTSELGRLTSEHDMLTGRVNRAVGKLEPTRRAAVILRAKVRIGTGSDPTSVAARGMVDFGNTVVEAVERRGLTEPPMATQTGAKPVIAPKSAAEIQLRDDALEAQTREMLEMDPEAQMHITDADGTVREITARELLDDLADDETLLKALQACAAGALV
jgi:hypothetical protein